MFGIDELCSLIEAVVRNAGGEPAAAITPDTPLLVSGLLDSLSIMAIVSEVSAASDVVLPETAVVARNFRSPRALWTAIEAARAGDDAPGAAATAGRQ